MVKIIILSIIVYLNIPVSFWHFCLLRSKWWSCFNFLHSNDLKDCCFEEAV